ncbi:hypothetical protein [Mesorhizobium sp. LMG 17147]|uniref:hypothetical protein n=1 Tax=Mesorhizobium sp. LMG 17147 TaxID=2963091 RepID=UPI0020C9B1C1|nr:hypothetical protein [Mesorhizobium sp. LMG 17147]
MFDCRGTIGMAWSERMSRSGNATPSGPVCSHPAGWPPHGIAGTGNPGEIECSTRQVKAWC